MVRVKPNRLDPDEKSMNQIHTPGGNQKVTIINESGLYNVLLRSDKPEAKPWLVGKDVSKALGYSNPRDALRKRVDDEDKQFLMINIADSQNGNLPTGQSKTAFINESGLYSLVLSSKLPGAKKFKRWVKHS